MKETIKEIFNKRKYEFAGIALMVLAVLNALSLFTQSAGLIGDFVNEGFRYLIGQAVYFIPLILVLVGITMIYRSRTKISFTPRTIGVIMLFLIILATLHLQVEHPLEFQAAFKGEGGGLAGAFLVYILRKCFAEYGTYVILASLTLISILLISDIFLVSIFTNFKETLNKFRERLNSKTEKFSKKNLQQQKSSKDNNYNKEPFWQKVRMTFRKDKEENITKSKKKDKVKNQDLKDKTIKKVSFNNKNKKKQNKENTKSSSKKKTIKTAQQEVAASNDKIIVDRNNKARKRIKKKIKTDKSIQEHLDLEEYILPPLSLLSNTDTGDIEIIDKTDILRKTLDNFGVKAEVTDVNCGPSITRYEIQPAPGVKVSKILNLSDDIALSLAAADVRIEAPIPGKAAVGIEIPNDQKAMVSIRDMLESDVFQRAESKLTMALGKDISGSTVVADLSDMPHMLVAGSTGSGKSVFINTVINSILYKAKPDEVKFLLIDPKMVEFSIYKNISHLIAPVVTDSKKAATALRWVVQEMENRYELFAGSGARDLDSYNQKIAGEGSDPLPYIVVIIDELADLMMVAAKEVEDAICRLAQKARAAGIHLILATQRPSVDVITGLIKANIPTRVSFSLSSQADSRTILDTGGAEKLLGKGDMLFAPVGSNQPIRLQGAFISDQELREVVGFVKQQQKPEYAEKIAKIKNQNIKIELEDEKDELYEKAVKLVVKHRASISMLQRKLRIGYNRAARMIDRMEKDKVVGPHQGSKAREVLIKEEDLNNILGKKN